MTASSSFMTFSCYWEHLMTTTHASLPVMNITVKKASNNQLFSLLCG